MGTSKLKRFKNQVAILDNGATATADLVKVISDLHSEAGFGEGLRAFINAGGIQALVVIASAGWPADGVVSKSQHRYDTVIDKLVGDPYWDQPGVEREQLWRSPRRCAISCLAEMGNYRGSVVAMERTGFFQPDAMPKMLVQAFSHIDYNLHNRGYLWQDVKDQIQPIAIDLLNLAGNAATPDMEDFTCPGMVRSPALGAYMAQHTALPICKMYQDPDILWVQQAAKDREKLRQKRRAQGWEHQRIEAEIQAFKARQHAQMDETEYGLRKHFRESGGLCYYFIRFTNAVAQLCSKDQLLALIHEAGLITKLKGTISPLQVSPPMVSPDATCGMLSAVWSQMAGSLSKKLYKTIEGEEATSLKLRQAGNDAFKQGKLSAPLRLYYQAAGHNPQDYALFNNISLVALKMGETHQAMLAAQEAIAIDPAVAKSCIRLGEAFNEIGRWQLAHLVYSCAHELAPADANIKARKEAARSHLGVVWDVDDIPHPHKEHLSKAVLQCLGVSKKEVKQAARGLVNDLQAMDLYDTLLSKRAGFSRTIACMQLKKDIEAARALAVATGQAKPAQLPPSCRLLKRIDQLPQVGGDSGQWTVSWTDTWVRHERTRLVRHRLTVMSDEVKATIVVLGTPGLPAVKRLMLEAMTLPACGTPCRPHGLFLAHRMFPLFDKVSEMCRAWGIHVSVETAAEARKSATNNDTDWEGYNCTEAYQDVSDDEEAVNLSKCRADPDNGHLAASN